MKKYFLLLFLINICETSFSQTIRIISDKNDTINCFNAKTGKQGKWITHAKTYTRIDYYQNNILNGYSYIIYKKQYTKLKYINNKLVDTIFIYDNKSRIREEDILLDTIVNTQIFFYKNGNIFAIRKNITYKGQLVVGLYYKSYFQNGQIRYLDWICSDSTSISKAWSYKGKLKEIILNKNKEPKEIVTQLIYPGYSLEICRAVSMKK